MPDLDYGTSCVWLMNFFLLAAGPPDWPPADWLGSEKCEINFKGYKTQR